MECLHDEQQAVERSRVCAAQEFTLISPEFHREFMWQDQMPIMRNFGLVHYGCCEDLTGHVMSRRPNPTDMVCAGWDEARIRRIIGEGGAICRGLHMHIHLKDVETVQGEPSRLARWVRLVRDAVQ